MMAEKRQVRAAEIRGTEGDSGLVFTKATPFCTE
jgi:hypothetical protein